MRGTDGIRDRGGDGLNSTTACMAGRTNEAAALHYVAQASCARIGC